VSRFILTAAEMRSAEAAAITAGTPARLLMERAGTAATEAIWRFAGPLPALVLCGPGNNGGDGYVIARRLAERGAKVRVAALAEPRTADAKAARAQWRGPVESLADAEPAPLLVDALFGTGLARPLDEAASLRLGELAGAARVRAAIDLPSGVATDDGTILSLIPDFDLTIAFAALKPSHLLQPAARHMGRIVVADIGISAPSRLAVIDPPALPGPGPDDHKYSRGYLLVVGVAMPGAAALAASAAARCGAGYVALVGEGGAVANAVVRRSPGDLDEALADARIGAVLVGPGLGRDSAAWDRLGAAMRSPHPLVLDGDALWLIARRGCPLERAAPIVTTPHAGEFRGLYGDCGSKVEAARSAAARTGHVVVYKGPDTVVAEPDGRAALSRPGSRWLASAGTGDVLAGAVAARIAAGLPAFEGACAGVWLHARSAELAGPGLIADDLPGFLPAAVDSCR
jgi:hydroxyethylthiazole kinase-like uncharacterized protein yjeF